MDPTPGVVELHSAPPPPLCRPGILQASSILGRTDSYPPQSFQLLRSSAESRAEPPQRAVALGFTAQGVGLCVTRRLD